MSHPGTSGPTAVRALPGRRVEGEPKRVRLGGAIKLQPNQGGAILPSPGVKPPCDQFLVVEPATHFRHFFAEICRAYSYLDDPRHRAPPTGACPIVENG